MTATLTASRTVSTPFADGFAVSGMNVRANTAAWRLATTDPNYAAQKLSGQVAVRLLTASTTAQHQAIPATQAFKTPAAHGTKGSSPWRFPV